MSYSKPLVFFGALVLAICIGQFVPIYIKSFVYACSLLIKGLLILVLPFVIFCLMFTSISALGSKALKYIALIIPLICCSNFINTMFSYFLSNISIRSGMLGTLVSNKKMSELAPLFEFNIDSIVSNDVALIGGLLLSLVIGIAKPELTEKVCKYLNRFTDIFFKILTPLMPIFIVGTALKLQHDGILGEICTKYLPILLMFIISAYGTVLLQFYILSNFNVSQTGMYLKNLTPAMVTAFGSMSSAAALPSSIEAAEKNVMNNKNNANIIAPASVNIHLVGDCFFIPMVALSVMTSFGLSFPALYTYSVFAIHFVLAKFSVAAIPGGGVFVMFPIMQDYLHMSSDMLAIVTALYLLFDPIITTCNVSGNGALAIVFDRLTKIFKK